MDSLEDKMAAKLIGFVKKTQKTPPKEIKLAKQRRADWLKRHKKEK